MFNPSAYENAHPMMAEPSLNFGDTVNFRSYAKLVRCAAVLSRQITDMMHAQEQFMAISTMARAAESGNLTKSVIEAADPHGVMTTKLGIAPATLSDIPLHKNDPRGKLFIQGLESMAAPTVGSVMVDASSHALTTLSELFDRAAPCIADISARADALSSGVTAMIEQNRYNITMSAPYADDMYATMALLADVSMPEPSLSTADRTALQNIIHAVGHLISLEVQGDSVVPTSLSIGDDRLSEKAATVGELGYTKINASGVLTKTKEAVRKISSLVQQKDAIMSRFTDLQQKMSTDPAAVSSMIGWASCYSELIAGVTDYATEALSIIDCVVNGDSVMVDTTTRATANTDLLFDDSDMLRY